MTQNNGTIDNYECSNGMLVPFINEFTWPSEVRAFLYLCGLLYCFMGVAIIADIFMGAIEKITSTTRKVLLYSSSLLIVYFSISGPTLTPSGEYSASNRIYELIPWCVDVIVNLYYQSAVAHETVLILLRTPSCKVVTLLKKLAFL